jgi:anti-sigma regulatory factor (Ser/Thr protein kinase)
VNHHERSYPSDRESVTSARHFVATVLGALPPETVMHAELLVSELTTNAVRHADAGFTLRINMTADELRVEVTDIGAGVPVRRSPGLFDASGRGLQIVEALSDAWGFDATPSGKTVWFTLALPTVTA